MRYLAVIHKEDNSCYGVSFPDFPGCITAADDLDEAKSLASEVLSLHINGMLEDGEQLPAPSTREEVIKNPDFADAAEIFAVDIPSIYDSKYAR